MGKEGPMIHSGAIVGAGIPQVLMITCWSCDYVLLTVTDVSLEET